MPLYFFLSGLFFKVYSGYWNFIKRKINKLVIPFVFFFIASCLFFAVLYYTGIKTDKPFDWSSLYAFCIPSERLLIYNSPIWFLLCLFGLNLMFYPVYLLCDKMGKYKVHLMVIISLSVGLSGWSMGQYGFQLPFFLDTAMTCMPFFCMGYLFNKHSNILYPNKYDKYNYLLIIVLFTITTYFSISSSYRCNTFGNPVWLYTCGLTGTLGVMLLAKQIKWLPCVSYWGRYSIMILVTHKILIQIYMLAIPKFIDNNVIQTFVVLLITLFSYMAIIPLFLKFLPYVTAQKDLIKV